jgi:GTP-binding protein
VRFVDQVRIVVRAGDGGDGLVGWRREKFVPDGGPAGGDGGNGGDIVFVADDHLTTLLDLKFRQHFAAEPGKPGGPNKMAGRAGSDLRVRVPVGTQVIFEAIAGPPGERPPWLETDSDGDEMENIGVTWANDPNQEAALPVLPEKKRGRRHEEVELPPETGEVLADLTTAGQELVIARGGKGGRGNVHFRSSTNRAPDNAEPGTPGEAFLAAARAQAAGGRRDRRVPERRQVDVHPGHLAGASEGRRLSVHHARAAARGRGAAG